MVPAPQTGEEQVKTEQLMRHLPGSLTVLLRLCPGLFGLKADHFPLQEKMVGIVHELAAHSPSPGPLPGHSI